LECSARIIAGVEHPIVEGLIMNRKIYLAVLLALAGWLATSSSPSQAAESTESQGLPVGARAPEFKLKDKDAQEHSLSDLRKKGKFVALVFYRSADW